MFCCLAGTKDIETLMLSCNNAVCNQNIELELVLDLINAKSCPRRRLYVNFFYLRANNNFSMNRRFIIISTWKGMELVNCPTRPKREADDN